jgi:hypothetical protein
MWEEANRILAASPRFYSHKLPHLAPVRGRCDNCFSQTLHFNFEVGKVFAEALVGLPRIQSVSCMDRTQR